MGTVTIVTPWTSNKPDRIRMTISCKDPKGSLVVPFAPQSITYGGFALGYNNISRPRRKPLTMATAYNLRTMTFKLFLVTNKVISDNNGHFVRDLASSIDPQLVLLQKFAATTSPITVNYDAQTVGNWVISNMSFDSLVRSPINDDITQADVQLEFTEYYVV